jgi:hypothetical protein
MSEPTKEESVIYAAIIGLLDGKVKELDFFHFIMEKLNTAVTEAQAEMVQRCIQECAIVRDSPLRCVEPCTEDWIARRMQMLSPDPHWLEGKVLEARKQTMDAIAELSCLDEEMFQEAFKAAHATLDAHLAVLPKVKP